MNNNNNPNMTPGMQNQPQPNAQPTNPGVPPVNPASTPAANPNPAANPVHTPSASGSGAPTPTRRPTPPKIKKSYNPLDFIGEAFKNLWRDGIMSLASILVLASCLVVLGCFALLVLNINVNMDKLTSLNEIVAFTDYEMSEEDALALAEEIKNLDNVEEVEFISKSQGLEDLKKTYPEFADLFDEFEEEGTGDTEDIGETTPVADETETPTTEDTAAPDTDTAETPDSGDGASVAAPEDADTASPEDTTAPEDTSAPAQTEPETSPETAAPAETVNNKNPLAHCYRIKYTDNSKVATLEFNLNEMEGIRKVNNRQDLAMSLENLKNGISMIFIWFLVVLFVVSVFIIINTIKLAVNSHMEEIRVMKYIGASNWFIVIPYIIEGTIIGIFSGAIAFLVEWAIYYKIGSIISTDTPIIELISFDSLRLPAALAFLVLGILTGVIGSCISLRKNLNA